jgi:hypothetical protein
MACTACLVCFISTVNGHCNKKKKRKEEACPWKAGANNGHTTNLKQSFLRLSISMVGTDICFYCGHPFLSPHGTTLMAFADVKYGCLWMLDGVVSTHPDLTFSDPFN